MAMNSDQKRLQKAHPLQPQDQGSSSPAGHSNFSPPAKYHGAVALSPPLQQKSSGEPGLLPSAHCHEMPQTPLWVAWEQAHEGGLDFHPHLVVTRPIPLPTRMVTREAAQSGNSHHPPAVMRPPPLYFHLGPCGTSNEELLLHLLPAVQRCPAVPVSMRAEREAELPLPARQ